MTSASISSTPAALFMKRERALCVTKVMPAADCGLYAFLALTARIRRSVIGVGAVLSIQCLSASSARSLTEVRVSF